MVARITFSVLILFSVLFLPFWVTAILTIVGIFLFSFYLESVFLLFLSDLLFGVKEEKLFGIFFFSFITSLIFLLLVEISKRKIKFYNYKGI